MRLTSPFGYLALLGGLQVTILWVVRSRFGTGFALAATLGLVLLLAITVSGVPWPQKFAALAALVALTTVGPAAISMAGRPASGLTIEHDGLVQTEAAIDRVLKGQRIYGVDWSNTALANYQWPDTAKRNPALRHFVYLPLMVLMGVPARLLTRAMGVPFDYRLVLLAFIPIGLWAAWAFPLVPARRFMIAVAVFLNPLISIYLWTGRNDISFVVMLLVALALLSRGHPTPASAALGLAVAMKPFALLAVPFFGLALWLHWQRRPLRHRAELMRSSVAFLAPPLLTILPFFLTDPGAFVRDSVLYTSGGVANVYPITGYGLGAILLALHVIADPGAAFPFWLFQLAAALAVLWLAGRAILRRATLGRWMASYIALFFAVTFFARFFNDNYLGVIMALLFSAIALGDAPLTPRSQATQIWR